MLEIELRKGLVRILRDMLSLNVYMQRPGKQDAVYPYVVVTHFNTSPERDTSGKIIEEQAMLLTIYATASDTVGGDEVAHELAERIVETLRENEGELIEQGGGVIDIWEDQSGLEEDVNTDPGLGVTVWQASRSLEFTVSLN